MKKTIISLALLLASVSPAAAQRTVDRLDRSLVAMKVSGGVYLSWRLLGEEYYDVTYNVYRDGVRLNSEPLATSNYKDTSGTTSASYTVAAVVRGKEQAQCPAAAVWQSNYKEIKLKHEGIASKLIPNDACCADVTGDGQLEILMKFDNESEIAASYPRDGYKGEYSIFEVLRQDGERLWWVNCGPNMGDFQNNEQNIVAYDWDGDGKAEAVMRAADGTVIHMADGRTYTVGNASVNYRGATGGGANWFMHDGAEYLVYMNGETGEPYQCVPYPLKRLESGETDLNAAWGDGYGHRSSKHFFGAPYLDGRRPSIFLARGIYTRHKMVAYDVDPATHKLVERWRWNNNTWGPWKGQGYHNYVVADVDLDGRDEIVFGSMVIDDNGKGLSTSGLGHGDAQHVGDFNPYIHGLEFFGCNEDRQGYNYRDATTSTIYKCMLGVGKDVGRSMCANFTDDYPGCVGVAYGDPISTVANAPLSGLTATGVNTNFRIYWDGDLLSETFNYINGKNTAGVIAKYGSWTPIHECLGSLTNNDTKGTPCYQGDILGDWREEIIMRTADGNIRIYTTPVQTPWRNYTLWHDHQYRNAMVWQMCGYNQPPHPSYFLGKLENITVAPPPLIMTGRTEIADGGSLTAALDGQHAMVCDTRDTHITIAQGAQPSVLTFNVPTWVQGTAPSETTQEKPRINTLSYTCTVEGGGLAGEARLVKQGDGTLTLPDAEFAHTGATDVWGGTLNFNGALTNSPLWLNRFARLNSDGGRFASIKADYASVISPGGSDAMGSMTAGRLDLGFGARLQIDLYSEGTASDTLRVGTLAIERKSGAAWTLGGPKYLAPVIELTQHLASGETQLAPGDYVIGVVDNIEGSVDNIILEGLATAKKTLVWEDGKLILRVEGLRDAASVTWTGAENGTWDFAETANFSLDSDPQGAAVTFISGDDVLFPEEAGTRSVTVRGNVIPGKMTVSSSSAYTIAGSGSIAGAASLVKEGEGTLTISTKNSYTGGNHLRGGTTKISSLSNQYTETGNLGAVTKSAADFTMENGAELLLSASVEQGSPMQMVGDEGGVINQGSYEFLMDAAFSGTRLTKKGSGWLKAYGGGSLKTLAVAGGTVDASSKVASQVVVSGNSSLVGSGFLTTPIEVAKGAKAQLTTINRATTNLALTGEGQITVYCATEKGSNYYATRTPVILNMKNFAGTLVAEATYAVDGRFTFDTSNGGDKWTLQIPAGRYVQNTGKTLRIGRVTGTGTLGGSCAFSNGASVGANTWQVGADDDFKFEAKVTGADKFTKMGGGKMTVSSVWDNTGAVRVSQGTLHMMSASSLGTGTLTVDAGAKLSGVSKSTSFTNSSVSVSGTLHPGATASSVSGSMDFGGKNLTLSRTSTLVVGLRKGMSATASVPSNTYITHIGTLNLAGGATIAPFLYADYEPTTDPASPDMFVLWTDVTKTTVGDVQFALPELPRPYSYWDTSEIANGVLYVRCDADKYADYVSGISDIDPDETVSVEVFAADGTLRHTFTCRCGDLRREFRRSPLTKGAVYMLKVNGRALKLRF